MTSRRKEGMSNGIVIAGKGAAMEQARAKIERRFFRLLKPGATELDIVGIKGFPEVEFPGRDSYLGCLKSFEHTIPKVHGTLSIEERTNYRKEILELIHAEVQKYEKILAKLSKSPDAIRAYILELESYVVSVEKSMFPNPEAQPIEVLKEHERLGNKRRKEFIAAAKVEIKKYSTLLATLK